MLNRLLLAQGSLDISVDLVSFVDGKHYHFEERGLLTLVNATHRVNGPCTYKARCTFTVGEQIEFEMWILVMYGFTWRALAFGQCGRVGLFRMK